MTGEATPVQKYSAPNTSSVYEVGGHGARHTLFSGSKVLQAGSMQNHDVLAVVMATGNNYLQILENRDLLPGSLQLDY